VQNDHLIIDLQRVMSQIMATRNTDRLSPDLSATLAEIRRLVKAVRPSDEDQHECVSETRPDVEQMVRTLTGADVSESIKGYFDLHVGKLFFLVGEMDKAQMHYQKALALSHKRADLKLKADTCKRIGDLAYRQNRWDEAENNYLKALELYKQSNDLHGQAHILNDLASMHFPKCEWERLEQGLNQALQTGEQCGDLSAMAKAHNNLAVAAGIRGDFDRVKHHLSETIALFEKTGDRRGLAEAYHNIALINKKCGKWEHAGKLFARALAIAREINHIYLIGLNYYHQADLALEMADYEVALGYGQKCIEYFERLGNREGLAEGYRLMGRIHRFQGQYQPAMDYLKKSLFLNREISQKRNEGETLRELGLLWRAQNQPRKAKQSLELALHIFRGTNSHEEFKRTKELLEQSDTN